MYTCPVCNKNFHSDHYLAHHQRTIHEGQKPFKCEFCQFKCSQRGNLRRHTCYVRRGENNELCYEKAVTQRLAARIGGKTEVCVGGTRIDILTDAQLIEVKLWKYFYKAIGQVLYYQQFKPNHALRIHFYGVKPPETQLNRILKTCRDNNILVSWENNENDILTSETTAKELSISKTNENATRFENDPDNWRSRCRRFSALFNE